MNVSQKSEWWWWQTALSDPSKIGTSKLPIHENEPNIGYYRMRPGKTGEMVPVAIIRRGADLVAVVGPWAEQQTRPADDVWTWCCRHPIHHKRVDGVQGSVMNWTDVAVDGKPWPDSIRSLIQSQPDVVSSAADADIERGIGDNSGAEPVSERDKLRAEMEEIAGKAKAFRIRKGKVSLETWTETDRDVLANAVAAISTIAKKAENIRKVEKQPHLDKCREIDSLWNTVVKQADEIAKDLKSTVGEFLRLQEAQKAEERKRERDRLEAERAKLPAAMQDLAPEPANDLEELRVRAGTAGRTIGLVDRYVAIIHNPIAFATHLLTGERPTPEVMDVLQTIANRHARAIHDGSYEVPGVRAEHRREAR